MMIPLVVAGAIVVVGTIAYFWNKYGAKPECECNGNCTCKPEAVSSAPVEQPSSPVEVSSDPEPSSPVEISGVSTVEIEPTEPAKPVDEPQEPKKKPVPKKSKGKKK